MRSVRNTILVIASVALVGLAVNAFAHGGMGWGGGWGHHGGGMHHYGGYGPGTGDQISGEQYRQFEQKREAFFEETRELRENLYEKERELQNELAKGEPDGAKASGLQKDISGLQSQLDQKRIDHMIEMRKLVPETGRGTYRGGGHMMGYGSSGRGNCWD